MKYVVALDIGIASVGWAVVDKETESILEAGSNLFPEASAADNQVRRGMRQARRMKRREKTRLNDFNSLWEKYHFIIPDYKVNDIVGLKVKALQERISRDELYLILYSYLKHRGISYLEDAEDDTVSGTSAYADGLKLNAKELEARFPCEIQKDRLEKNGKYRGQTQVADVNGDKVDLSNVFTIGAYRKEIQQVLKTQQGYYPELEDEFCDEYLAIFNRKRKYYEGPGNEKSRTDYGKYTTKLNEKGEYITEKNIFEKLIGKCSVYEGELRAAAASYSRMKYKIMRMICMFDLPVETEVEKRVYRTFRKNLIKEGFVMMQYSVYVRICPNREFAKRLETRIKKFTPLEGNVRLLCVTEKQYADMKLLVGSRSTAETAIGTERLIVI